MSPAFTVTISRTVTQYASVPIGANDEEEAWDKVANMSDEAKDKLDWSEGTKADYDRDDFEITPDYD